MRILRVLGIFFFACGIVIILVLSVPAFLGLFLHALSDSEVGIMMYGMRFMETWPLACPVSLGGSFLWAIALRNLVHSRQERIANRISIAISIGGAAAPFILLR